MRLKSPTKRFIFGLTGIIGILLIVFGEGFLYWERRVLSFSTNPYTQVSNSNEANLLPKRIYIKNAGIDLAIEEGKIIDGVWQISNTTATHLVNSEVPGRNGNIVIYGHNLRTIFGKLVNVKKGDVIDLFAANGKKYEYKVSDILKVDPSDIEVVTPTKYPILTIYTCTGFLDSKRLVVKALPLG